MEIINAIQKKADMYEKDGKPGPLGYNCWGWTVIAETLKRIADEYEKKYKIEKSNL